MFSKEAVEIMGTATTIVTGIASPLILGLIYYIIRIIKSAATKRKQEVVDHDIVHDMLIRSIMSIQRNDFVTMYKDVMKKGYMTMYEKQSLLKMHESYKELGGNSFVDEIMEELKTIPTKG